MVGVGVFIVGYRGATGVALFTGGTITGLGIASMHYLGMAGMRLNGVLGYNTLTVTASVVIAVVAATAALWAAGQGRGFLWSIGASLVLGFAVSGMHYTGMAALRVHVHTSPHAPAGESPAALLAPLMIGPLLFLCLAGVVVMFDPLIVMGKPVWKPVERKPGIPAHPELETPDGVRCCAAPSAPVSALPYGAEALTGPRCQWGVVRWMACGPFHRSNARWRPSRSSAPTGPAVTSRRPSPSWKSASRQVRRMSSCSARPAQASPPPRRG